MRPILLILIVLLFCFKFTRCIISNLFTIIRYAIKDFISYIVNQKWKVFHEHGVDIYIGDWGQGKTISAVETIVYLYKRYGVDVLSNIPLTIPYKKLNNYHDILDIEDDKGTIIFIDEIGILMSNREWNKFPTILLIKLLQCRKKKLMFIATAQEFSDIDIVMRKHTSNVILCREKWRLQNNKWYRKQDLESGVNPALIKSIGNRWWFIKDKHRKLYNTYFEIDNPEDFKAENYITNKELIDNTGMDRAINNVASLTKKGKKMIRK